MSADVTRPAWPLVGPLTGGRWIITKRCGICGSACGGDCYEAERAALACLRDPDVRAALYGCRTLLRVSKEYERVQYHDAAITRLIDKLNALGDAGTDAVEER